MPREPVSLAPDPPSEWLEELARRHPGVDPFASLPVIRLLNAARSIRAVVVPRHARIGLSEARFTVVMMIHRLTWERGAATPSELARQAQIGRAAMTQLLDGLEESGWIRRSTDTKDRRRVSITLSRAGQNRLNRYLPEHYRALAAMLDELSAAERRTLMALLGKLEAALPPDSMP